MSGRQPGAAAMAAHVRELCAENDVEYREYAGAGRAIRAWRGRPAEVRVRPVKGVSTYYVALHEVGHLVGWGRSARKLEAEANAWAWAIDHAIRPPTPGVRRMIRRSLASYLDAGRRGYGMRQSMVEPADDHVFWALLAEGGDRDRRPKAGALIDRGEPAVPGGGEEFS